MTLYRYSAALYMMACTLVYPVLCILGWVLLGRILGKHLQPYARWFIPSMIAATLDTVAVLLLAFVTYFDRRNYVLASVSYLMSISGLLFNVISFARLRKMFMGLPPAEIRQSSPDDGQSQEGVWPPRPKF